MEIPRDRDNNTTRDGEIQKYQYKSTEGHKQGKGAKVHRYTDDTDNTDDTFKESLIEMLFTKLFVNHSILV